MSDECVILLVEDDRHDAFFFSRALKKLNFPGTLQHVSDIKAAQSYLENSLNDQDRQQYPLPQIIVADSSMDSRTSGVDLLKWVRNHSRLHELPFVMHAGTLSPNVQAAAEALRVDGIVLKSLDFDDGLQQMRAVLHHLPAGCREWLK